METFADVMWALFLIGSAGIVINRVRANGLIAGVIFSIFPVFGLAISILLLSAFLGVFVGAAYQFEEKQQAPPSPAGQFSSTPGKALESALNEINGNTN